MSTIHEINPVIAAALPNQAAPQFDNTDLIKTGIQWGKFALNAADYIPFSFNLLPANINVLSARIRMYGAVAYMTFAVLQFGYNSFIEEKSDAKKILDRELAIGFKHLLRGALSNALNTYEFSVGTPVGIIKAPWAKYKFFNSNDMVESFTNIFKIDTIKQFATAIMFGSYDYYVSKQDSKERWFNFYA